MRYSLAVLLTLAPLLSGCADFLVTLGLREPSPIVTDSAYFNGQMEKLLNGVRSNRSRSFRKAAVLDFVNADGRVSELGRMLSTKFSERAVAGAQFRVAPAGQVKEALAGLKINYTGKLKKQEAQSIGEALGVDAVITGVLYDLQRGSDVDLTVNVIQPSSGDLVSAASVNIHRSKQVQSLIQQF